MITTLIKSILSYSFPYPLRTGVWSVPSRLSDEVNAAFRAHDHVIIYFLVRALKGMYGVARMGYGHA